MKLQIKNSLSKMHKELVITGNTERVRAVVDEINKDRAHYRMDYADFEELENGRSQAEFIAHRRHHKKAASFIREVIAKH
ncbi:hypothetical protein [Vibrio owensii]|uniref:hypothetical protein n=1 Tax=Vibrio owensii TaxID=696485 RepID=UPI0018F19F9D|nr:hypothetical protein [Vibrio owensii]